MAFGHLGGLHRISSRSLSPRTLVTEPRSLAAAAVRAMGSGSFSIEMDWKGTFRQALANWTRRLWERYLPQ